MKKRAITTALACAALLILADFVLPHWWGVSGSHLWSQIWTDAGLDWKLLGAWLVRFLLIFGCVFGCLCLNDSWKKKRK